MDWGSNTTRNLLNVTQTQQGTSYIHSKPYIVYRASALCVVQEFQMKLIYSYPSNFNRHFITNSVNKGMKRVSTTVEIQQNTKTLTGATWRSGLKLYCWVVTSMLGTVQTLNESLAAKTPRAIAAAAAVVAWNRTAGAHARRFTLSFTRRNHDVTTPRQQWILLSNVKHSKFPLFLSINICTVVAINVVAI